jgi:hypothetical protein
MALLVIIHFYPNLENVMAVALASLDARGLAWVDKISTASKKLEKTSAIVVVRASKPRTISDESGKETSADSFPRLHFWVRALHWQDAAPFFVL